MDFKSMLASFKESGEEENARKKSRLLTTEMMGKANTSGTSDLTTKGLHSKQDEKSSRLNSAETSSVVQPKQNSVSIVPIQDPCISSKGDFSAMGRRHGTDKITHHAYHRYYPRYLEHYRKLIQVDTSNGNRGSSSNSTSNMFGMLEIGVDRSHSLHTWLDYFPSVFIYGMDISVSDSGERYKIIQCDQSKIKDVQEAVQKKINHPLFFIIDDGSHVPEHQILCFDYLFEAVLLPGGTYIIEDIETSYWTRGDIYHYPTRYGYHHERSILEIFKDLLDDINREFLTEYNRNMQERRVGRDVSLKTRMEISTISFGQNCIIITKKTEEEKTLYNDRVYRFKSRL